MSDKTAALKMKDSSGNIDRILPKTKVANVEGLEDWDSAMLLKNVTVVLPVSASWKSVCYGNGKFVAVASSGTIAAYSTDGINWTQATLPVSASWRSVCYGNGKFVAVASTSTIAAYSTDGINWTQTTLPVKASWASVCYANGKFVAIPSSGTNTVYSTDGINWTQATLPVSASWYSVCYGNGKFVAIDNSNKYVVYSTDGITWTNVADVLNHPTGTDITSNLKKVLGVDTILSDANAYTDSAISDKATMTEVNAAIQAAIQNTWEASY